MVQVNWLRKEHFAFILFSLCERNTLPALSIESFPIWNRAFVRSFLIAALGGLVGIAAAAFPAVHSSARLPEITFIPRTSGTILTENMHGGANRASHESGLRLYWNAPTREDDVDRQILLMSTALNNHTRGLILGPTNGLAVTSEINEFISHRIPVVVVQTHSPIPAGPYITSIEPDQAQMSKLAAERIRGQIGDSGEVAVVGLDRTAPETIERARDFTAEMTGDREVTIVAQQRGSTFVPEAEQNAGEVLDKFPHLKAIFAVSATATEGAVLAAGRRGLSNSVILVGCDDDLFLRGDLHDGKLDSLVVADGFQMGNSAASFLLAAVQGKPFPLPQLMPVRLITRETMHAQSTQ
jgi:ribose transport system substrate-binding protein